MKHVRADRKVIQQRVQAVIACFGHFDTFNQVIDIL